MAPAVESGPPVAGRTEVDRHWRKKGWLDQTAFRARPSTAYDFDNPVTAVTPGPSRCTVSDPWTGGRTLEQEEDKRRTSRIVTENLVGSMALSLAADILNVSRGGLLVRTKHQLRVGSEYDIQIGENKRAVEVSGTVVRCLLKGTRKNPDNEDIEPIYEAGFRFDPPLDSKAKDLLPLMTQTASLKLTPRLYGRFRVEPHSEATLTSELEFEVRKISLSGLLAECEGPRWSGDSAHLEIDLGDETFASAVRIVDAKQIQSDDEGEPRMQYGVEFLEPEPEALECLEAFLLGTLAEGF